MPDIQFHARDEMLTEYEAKIAQFEMLSQSLNALFSRLLPEKLVVTTSHRVKDFDSFFKKANKLNNEKLKYQKPFEEISDLVGFRIIVIASRNVPEICTCLKKNLKLVEEENKAQRLLEQGRLGYESHHLIMCLGEDRQKLGEYAGLCGLTFEVQVRTVLQHAWAENEHRVQYKATRKDPELQKRFLRLAGLISSADEEFDRIYEINERLSKDVATSVATLEIEDEVGQEGGIKEKLGKPKRPHDEHLHRVAHMFGTSAIDLVRQQRYVEAIQVYDRFVSLQPNQPTHYAGRARAKALSGDIDGALDDLTRADEMAPDHPAVKNVLSILDTIIPRDID